MCLFPMAAPATTELRGRLALVLRYGAVGLLWWLLALALLQLLLGRVVERQRLRQLAGPVAQTSRLAELALERLPAAAVAELSGLPLRPTPPPPATSPQAAALERQLCARLDPCPRVRASGHGQPRGLWVELEAPLEAAWLFVPLPEPRSWPPDPLLLALAIVAAGLATTLTALTLEVQRPLARLERGLGQVGGAERPGAIRRRGRGAVRRLAARFNTMLERLEHNEQERATMLAGLAHDLNQPLTRLRLRLALGDNRPAGAVFSAADRAAAEAELAAIARMLRQFLQFATAVEEPPVVVPLDQVLAELTGTLEPGGEAPLALDLEPLERRVRVTALQRAVANLIDNACSHGIPPVRLVLRAEGEEGFRIEVWDSGPGLSPERWNKALQPFQRLDPARGGLGHCGLGLAIVARVAAAHRGRLSCHHGADGAGFAVCLHGRSHPVTSMGAAGCDSVRSGGHDQSVGTPHTP